MTFEYGVVIRRQRPGRPAVWQFWIGEGLVHEGAGFLALMNWAGERGFEAFAAGNFDEMGVPEVILKRAIALAPPPPLPAASGRAGGELGSAPASGVRSGVRSSTESSTAAKSNKPAKAASKSAPGKPSKSKG
jgi:hypothetical protein